MPKTIATTPSWYWPDAVPRVLGVPPVPLADLVLDGPARHHAEADALGGAGGNLSAAELATRVRSVAAALRGQRWEQAAVAVSAGPTSAGVLAVLGALVAGCPVVLVPPGQAAGAAALQAVPVTLGIGDADGIAELAGAGVPTVTVDELADRGLGFDDLPVSSGTGPVDDSDPGDADGIGDVAARQRKAAVCMAGTAGPVWHSHRSLLAGALALGAFLGPDAGSAWLTLESPCSWDGLCGVLAARLSGAAVLAAHPGAEAVDMVERCQPIWTAASLADAASTWSGGGRRRRGGAGSTGRWLVASVDGPFDPDERRAVAGSSGTGVLTMFGLAETGPVLAAHPSWYLEEAAGIPVPNMHVVPADPDTGEPIDAMWELLDRAMVSVWSPSLAVAGIAPGPGEPAGRRYATGILAASDPNGMLYLVDE
ncbi:MAG: hypothetical protein M0Z63_02470 [Actinomycetota bacterium]|jgi:hypothetical protein|nr:hypothetical protein [Actinomycetota bacterium]